MNKIEIMALLASPSEDTIREGAHLAGDSQLQEAIPTLIQLLQCGKLGVIEAVERALKKIGGSQTIVALVPLLRSDDATIRNSAMELLRKVGNQDLPTLFELLYDDDADIRIFVSDILGKCKDVSAVAPLATALLKDPEVNVRYQAAVSLGDLGFSQAAESLTQALGDEEWVQFSAIEALTKIRAEASITPLLQALRSSTPLVASMIIDALGEIGNIQAVPLLMKNLHSAKSPIKEKLAKAIVQVLGIHSLPLMSQSDQNIIKSTLVDILSNMDEDEPMQEAALIGLSVLGGIKSSRVILKYLSQLDQDRDFELVELAIKSLSDIGFNETIESAVIEGPDEVRAFAIKAMTSASTHACVDLIKTHFWASNRDVQRVFMDYLAEKSTSEDIDFFIEVIGRHEDGTILKSALSYLSQNATYSQAGEAMFHLIEHPYDDVKEAALETCIKMNAPEMVAHFKIMARSSVDLDRMMGVYALGRHNIDDNIDILNEALEDGLPDVRRLAVEAFCKQCPMSQAHMDYVVPRLFDENRDVRLAVLDALGRCSNDSSLELLVRALDDEDIWVKVRVIEALGNQRFEEVVPRLIELLNHNSQLIIIKSIESLAQIGGKDAFAAILNLVAHKDPEIQQATEAALEHMRLGRS